MGGLIGVEDNPGGGSKFWFTLKLADGFKSVSTATTLKDSHVLIAGCGKFSAEAMRRSVVDSGGTATGAYTIAEAQRLISETGASTPFTTVLLSELAIHNESAPAAELVREAMQSRVAPGLVVLYRTGGIAGQRPIMTEGVPILSLPVHRAQLLDALRNPHAAGESRAAHPSRALRILLADDASVNRTIGVIALGRAGHRVDVVLSRSAERGIASTSSVMERRRSRRCVEILTTWF
jgi:hypothetical protein